LAAQRLASGSAYIAIGPIHHFFRRWPWRYTYHPCGSSAPSPFPQPWVRTTPFGAATTAANTRPGRAPAGEQHERRWRQERAALLGGGGGAGNGNNTFAGGGGSGGGLAFVIAGNVAGSGSILANGQDGNPANSGGSASATPLAAAGGGGTVVVHAGTLASTSGRANGELGGGQINLNNAREAEVRAEVRGGYVACPAARRQGALSVVARWHDHPRPA